ncbi:transposase [Pseudonocardia sp. CA-142604]|uniref:transposase n=1 Tax=Pseudonocardia sp. CA-142604 TaxID=3240024 RepID=UPI003D938FE1
MGSEYTKRHTEEFKRDVIALVDFSSRTVTAFARELGISSESLRGWYRQVKADRGERGSGELTSSEREVRKRPRREVREQQQTIEILKKRRPLRRSATDIAQDVATGGAYRRSGRPECADIEDRGVRRRSS